MKVYLVDGTYELFRHYFAVPKARDARGREVGAVRGVLALTRPDNTASQRVLLRAGFHRGTDVDGLRRYRVDR